MGAGGARDARHRPLAPLADARDLLAFAASPAGACASARASAGHAAGHARAGKSHTAESAAYNVGAGIATFDIPGRAACGLGGAVGIFILIISIGSAPRPAAYFAREGCGGKWVLTGDDLRPDDAHYRAFDWEGDEY